MRNICLFIILVSSFFLFSPNAFAEPNWNSISKNEVTMVYLGVASWEFLNSKDHGFGARNISKGRKSCVKCHVSEGGEYDILTNEIAAGKYNMKKSKNPFEPTPLTDKKGFFASHIQAAYDNEYIYIRLEWISKGVSWLDAEVGKAGLADRVALQINKGNKEFKQYGCMISCHDSLPSMPNEAKEEEVSKKSYYSKKKRDSLRLYSYYTRGESGAWNDILPKAELDAMLKGGRFTDLWEAEFEGETVVAEDGWILEDRDYDKSQDVTASGRFSDGKYSVVFKRKLKTGDKRDVELSDGDEFSIGIAIHDNKAKKRQHYISFPLTVGLGASGDVIAKKLKVK